VADIAVIFDMDGVLVASGSAHAASWRKVARTHGKAISDADFARLFGMPSRDIIRTLWGELSDADVRAIDDEKEALYRRLITGMVPLTIGVRETLAGLREAGLPLAVGTSGPRENVDLVLDETRLRPMFDAIVTGFDVTRGKPAPDCFLLAAERLGVPPGRCVVVEDAPVGVQAARAAGMACVAYVGTHSRERLAAEGPSQIVGRIPDVTSTLVRDVIALRS
jgi:beta-phosphoglucomutase